jgi:pullulanase/glycogen debranching enzyme
MFKYKNTLWLFLALFFISCAGQASQETVLEPRLDGAEAAGANLIYLRIANIPDNLETLTFTLQPNIGVEKVQRGDRFIELITKQRIDVNSSYQVIGSYQPPAKTTSAGETVKPEPVSIGSVAVQMENLQVILWNQMYSDKPLGHNIEGGSNVFRVFVPRGKVVELHIFNKPDDAAGTVYPMTPDENMVFEARVPGNLAGKFYGYRIAERTQIPTMTFKPDMPLDTIFADPYSKAVASSNVFPSKMRTLILPPQGFDWQGTQSPGYEISDLIIFEAHVRDLTAHPSAQTPNPGTFKGIANARVGGLTYMKRLGVNAIEFLPIHEFNNIEAPFNERSRGIRNTWNAYAQNYWGYMTSNYFALESYYATDGTIDPNRWSGIEGRSVTEFKELVRELHRNGIAVIMDVVYNHVSGYDENPFKIIDMDFYFKKVDRTGTGNEFETRRRMARRVVLDSLKYFMQDYRVDGFRFDLAASHDRDTITAIRDELRAINPKVYLIAEPWGGEGATNSQDFIRLGWSKWNSGIRDAVRSVNRPADRGQSWALGTNNGGARLEPYLAGVGEGQPWQLVHYIESHDDTTFGDNIRIMSGFYSFTKDGQINRITDLKAYLKLPPNLLDASRVAAAALLMAQGPVMIHVGQEWARGKVTPDLTGKVPEVTNKGRIGTSSDNVVYLTPTPNSYSADNETNWINFEHVALNQELFDYYAGLNRLRLAQPLLRKADPKNISTATDPNNGNAVMVLISDGQRPRIFGAANSDPRRPATFQVPAGNWTIVVDKTRAGTTPLGSQAPGDVTVPPASALILISQ